MNVLQTNNSNMNHHQYSENNAYSNNNVRLPSIKEVCTQSLLIYFYHMYPNIFLL